MTYAELHVTTHYSFLRGASSPEELFAQAAAYGLPALGVADHNTVAGIVRAWAAARATGVRLVAGARLNLRCGAAVLAYPTDTPSWSRLCHLLTLGKGRNGHRTFDLGWEDVADGGAGLVLMLLPGEADALPGQLAQAREAAPGRAYVAGAVHRRPGDAVRLHRLSELGRAASVPMVATGNVLFHHPERRILQDVVTCIRHGCTIDDAGFRRERHADRHLKPPGEMARLFAAHPDALARTGEITDRCRFDLGELRYQYPEEADEPGQTPQLTLDRLTWAGAAWRYPGGVPDAVAKQLRHELRLIAELQYAPYFLTVHSIVRHARGEGILCQGRGSAANSAVCWVLGITSVDPTAEGLLFERFISAARKEPPDIDVDFEHERREDVIQWVYARYGRAHAALCATVLRYRARGAVRDVGKALGLTADVTGALASQVWGWSDEGVTPEHGEALGLNIGDRRLRLTLDLARALIGTPRHLGTHPGGFVLTEAPLADLVPVVPAAMVNRQVIEWDKDDIDLLRFMKVDLLGLGMLGCMRRAFALLQQHHGIRHDLASIPADCPATFEMICRADTLGTFQIESRAQMSMLPRMKPRRLYDLVIQVAIVRPGPIQGDMVHPYLRRREGKEPVTYPTPELEGVLGKTLGVPLFQEQAMRVAIVCAGFTPDEADQLRRAMATFKQTGGVSHFEGRLVEGMVARGYDRAFAERMFEQVKGFGSYGFPESHAVSFALVAYASSWMKCHHPDVFCAALLNSQPMGFYAPAQVVRCARDHGVKVRPVDVNASDWDCSLEGDGPVRAVRLGLRMVKGLAQADAGAVAAGRPYADIADLWLRSGVATEALERLADADALRPLGLDRRAATWAIRALQAPLPLFTLPLPLPGEGRGEGVHARPAQERAHPAQSSQRPIGAVQACTPSPRPFPGGRGSDGSRHDPDLVAEPPVRLPPLRAGREVVEDYVSTGLTLRQHPVAFLRGALRRRGAVTCAALEQGRNGRRVLVAGLVLVRQKPGSAKGVMFITAEDETGIANLILWPQVFALHRRIVLSATMLACQGRVQRESGVTHVITERLHDLSGLLRSVGERDGPWPLTHGRGDEAKRGGGPDARTVARNTYLPAPGIRVPTRDFR